jgi:hypothetical protein
MNFQRISGVLLLIVLSAAMLEGGVGFVTDQAPAGWLNTNPLDYEAGIDTGVKHSGKASGYLKLKGSISAGFETLFSGMLMQRFKTDDYRGKRVRLSAYVKTEEVGSARLAMSVDGERGLLGFDRGDNRQIKGTTEWTRQEIVLDVPENSVSITFGVAQSGGGRAWVDDFKFEVVGEDVPSTNTLTPEILEIMRQGWTRRIRDFPKHPVNLDFEN